MLTGNRCTSWKKNGSEMWKRLGLLLMLVQLVQCGSGRCGDRLERALDMMQQRTKTTSRRRYDQEDADMVFYQRLSSAPIDVSVTKMVVEIPNTRLSTGRASSSSSSAPSSSWFGEGVNGAWARVERCAYEPSSSSVRTRVAFSELSVTGLVQLSAAGNVVVSGGAAERRSVGATPSESCKMSLRLRRAGMEFHTSPIARARGQMRIRTESSFLEPKFASIYAYGCRPVFVQPRDASGSASAAEAAITNNDSFVNSEPRQAVTSSSGSAKARHLQSLFGHRYDKDGGDRLMQDVGADLDDNDQDLDLDGDERANRLQGLLLGPSGHHNNHQQSSVNGNEDLLDSLWRSRGEIAREMEEVLLSSASQAVTHYIEKQLHPAIKETLMISMGYTISYG
ncbi:hypothetical protein QAD02_017356 [Eretmocerus hayati]|uniref:Uncharacterized protein n=1 Tax=Eretmocerus hayati TaxID=131215 RepID=A0ACC2PD89_9HYME|nr:hypothetical protein QAD02_017356 [Eretmocerus hayati]